MPNNMVPDTRKAYISAMGITALIILLLASSAVANTFEQWSKTFGGSGNDSAFSVQQTSDGGYILAGKTQSYGAGESDAWLIKTDANGTEQWNRTFGGKGIDEASSVQQTSDGGYILAGKTYSYGNGYGGAWLIKTDKNGKEQWNKTLEGRWAGSVQQTSDKGYALAGATSLPSGAPLAFWLIKIDTNGNEQWSRTFGGGRGDWANAVRQTSDGGYIIAGRRYIPGGAHAWLIETDSNGKERWSKTFGGDGYDEALSIQQTLDAGYIVAGKKEYPRGNTNAWLIKIDSNGNEQWNRTFGGEYNDEASSVLQTLDGGYIIAGKKERSYGDADAWLIKTDANGNEQWNETLEGREANSVQQTSDRGIRIAGDYIIVGDAFSDKTKSLDAWLIKVSEAPITVQLTESQRMSRLGPDSIYNQVYFSDRIVIGTVKELRPSSEFTDVFISVDEWLKNPLPKDEITVRMGRPNTEPPVANFTVGEKVLLMLDGEVEKGMFTLLYGDLGKHPVSDRHEVIVIIDKLLSPVATTPQIKTEISASEEKMLVVGGTWEKEGWNLSIKAVDKSAAPGFVLISLSYQGKELDDARIETGKSITYRGRNPDGSEVSLFIVKVINIFVGAGADAVRLELGWTAPMSGVQIIEAPVESEMQAETPVPTPTAQASPEAPGFEMVVGIIGILAIWRRLKK